MKKLYIISQDVNNGYDTYDSAVVCAESIEEARYINPGGFYTWVEDGWLFTSAWGKSISRTDDTWCDPKDVTVVSLGECTNQYIKPGEVVLASFNAG